MDHVSRRRFLAKALTVGAATSSFQTLFSCRTQFWGARKKRGVSESGLII